jgi:hypothetical protein
MIECLKRIIIGYQNLEPPAELLPRRVAIGSLPGKVSVVTGVGGSGKTTLLRQRIRQMIKSGVPRENILYLDLADNRLYWLWLENPDLILEAYFELHPQKRGCGTIHCFFDEVQTLPYWQLFIDRLLHTEASAPSRWCRSGSFCWRWSREPKIATRLILGSCRFLTLRSPSV